MQLEEIAEEHEKRFLASVAEWQGDGAPFVEDYLGATRDWTAAAYKKAAKAWAKERLDWRPGGDKTSVSRYVLVDPKGAIVAYGLMRFPLDERLEIDGGNLSCFVPASLRLRGFGSYCLALLLFEAVRAGLRRVLVTCPASDKIARKVIEKNRGRLEDTAESSDPRRKGEKIARYWIEFG